MDWRREDVPRTVEREDVLLDKLLQSTRDFTK